MLINVVKVGDGLNALRSDLLVIGLGGRGDAGVPEVGGGVAAEADQTSEPVIRGRGGARL